MPEQERWYKDGLRFECTQCGDCCTGEPGFVWVNTAEVEQLAAAVGLDVPTFRERYVRKVGNRMTLKERPGGDCVLLDKTTRKCTAYHVRPRQCRTWPFWESNLRSEEAWRQTCEVCPGCDRGTRVPVEQIVQQLAIIKI